MSRIHLEDIGKDRLRRIVDQADCTVTELARRCGITRSGFNVWLQNGKLPIKQFEKILVFTAFKNAEITDDPKPIQLGDKSFVPDFVVKPDGEQYFLTVEVKPNGVSPDQLQMLQKVGVDAIVYLDSDIVSMKMLTDTAEKKLVSELESELGEGSFSDPMPSNAPIVVKDHGNYASYSYLLRPATNGTVAMELPMDLTAREAERLSLYIKSLVTSDDPSQEQQVKKSKAKVRRGKTR